jgi:hypothetical protein
MSNNKLNDSTMSNKLSDNKKIKIQNIMMTYLWQNEATWKICLHACGQRGYRRYGLALHPPTCPSDMITLHVFYHAHLLLVQF